MSSGVQTWNAGAVVATTEREMLRRVQFAQVFLQNTIKRSINRGNPTGKFPSKPGEPPKKVSTRLFNSIAAPAPTVENGVIRGRVGTNVVYARRLEFGYVGTTKIYPRSIHAVFWAKPKARNVNQAPRPFLRPAISNNLPRLKQLLGVKP